MNYSLQMREVSNGCIIMDAQPCRKKLWGGAILCLQTHATNQARVLNPTTTFFMNKAKCEVKDGN